MYKRQIFHSGVGAAVLAALQRVGWSVHVGQKRDFVNPQGVDDDMHMDIPLSLIHISHHKQACVWLPHGRGRKLYY